jgi:hypothetical protein
MTFYGSKFIFTINFNSDNNVSFISIIYTGPLVSNYYYNNPLISDNKPNNFNIN